MPPDGFTLITGQARSLTLTLTLPADLLAPAGNADAETSGNTARAAAGAANSLAETAGDETEGEAASVEYRITRDADGRFLEFPFFRGGTFYQAAVVYDDTAPGRISKITLENPAVPDPWEFEFLEYTLDDPSLVRINAGGSWYFAVPEYLNRRTNETWYDPEGLVQAFFSLEYREDGSAKRLFSETGGAVILIYDYDSAGRISGTPVSSALYTAAARPRYWEGPEGNYTLQWDEQGFLVRQTSGQDLDIRYEYTLDERQNWTERRAISLTRRFDRLIPDAEVVIRRSIRYGDADND
jgi:YD repeat-containing protein